MIYRPSVDDIVALNAMILPDAETRVLNLGHVQSAVARPFHTFAGTPLYATIINQAGALLEGLVAAHGFQDGNKRTAWIAAKTFLMINAVPVQKAPAPAAADFVEGVAVHTYSGSEVARWVGRHLVAP